MEITFEKVNNEYIAEFEITTDSNLHIEKKCASSTKLYQRTNGGGWDLVDETKNMQGAVDDFDLSALVYPKFIKVVCNAEPLYAEVTTSGEVTEIKSQSKEIEVTSNGTTEVTPDAGFAYLNSVKVKTNVPTSGGGGGSASSWRYFAISGFTEISELSSFGVMMVKLQAGGVTVVLSAAYVAVPGIQPNMCVAYGVDMFAKTNSYGDFITWGEAYQKISPETFERYGIVEITEEEFYNLNA